MAILQCSKCGHEATSYAVQNCEAYSKPTVGARTIGHPDNSTPAEDVEVCPDCEETESFGEVHDDEDMFQV